MEQYTPEQLKDIQERLKKFLEESKELSKKYQIDLAPMIQPLDTKFLPKENKKVQSNKIIKE